jgi:hypothetical protein
MKKVFVSHASEDKERFVNDFAFKLRQRGIDAWLDKWEMLPGDSLVNKIFEEGIKNASAVIVVLSQFSVQKPWVREELNSAFVKKVSEGSKLIPVVIEDCEVPEALKHTVWQHIEDLSNYETSLERIISSILGTTDKPPLGQLPKYAVDALNEGINGLSPIDGLVLKLSCEEALREEEFLVNPGKAFLKEDSLLMPEEELKESLEVLDQNGYIKLLRRLGAGFFHFRVTAFGFNEYARAHIQDYEQIIRSIASLIVNKNMLDNMSIKEELKINVLIINHILDNLEMNRHIAQSKTVNRIHRIYNVSPSLKRMLQG